MKLKAEDFGVLEAAKLINGPFKSPMFLDCML
jgi:hypothetical protein